MYSVNYAHFLCRQWVRHLWMKDRARCGTLLKVRVRCAPRLPVQEVAPSQHGHHFSFSFVFILAHKHTPYTDACSCLVTLLQKKTSHTASFFLRFKQHPISCYKVDQVIKYHNVFRCIHNIALYRDIRNIMWRYWIIYCAYDVDLITRTKFGIISLSVLLKS